MKVKKTIILSVLVLMFTNSYSQQDAMYTQYMYNTISVNPAYAGSRDALSITALNRSQWIGLEGAPSTQTINIHTPVKLQNSGFGLSISNDKIGITKFFSAYADYSYKIQISKKSYLSFGLKAGADILSDDYAELITERTNDPTFTGAYNTGLLPNFGFGLYFFTHNLYLGASVPRILKYDYANSIIETDLKEGKQHLFFIAGYNFDVSNSFALRPTTLVKATKGAPIEFDFTLTAVYNNKLWAGAMYRTGDAGGVLAGINITDQFAIGYSYDLSFLQFSNNLSSHEIMIRYDFLYKNKERVLSPRYF